MAQFLQAQIKENLGIDMSLEPLDPPSFFGKVAGARQFQLAVLGWGADYPDPENFLAPLFMTGSPINIGGYSSPEFDRLAIEASIELDGARRLGLWTSAHEVMLADVPVAPFFYRERFFLVKPQVRGLTLTGIDGFLPGDTRFAQVTLAP